MNLLKFVEKKYNLKKIIFFKGWHVEVFYISELNKKKIISFSGIIINLRKNLINSTFKIRKKINNFKVEKIFHLHSPMIKNIKIIKINKNFKYNNYL